MQVIVFYGWETGMRKIPFVKLLHEAAGLSLTEAKGLKDRLVDHNEVIELELSDMEAAMRLLAEARQLKVKCSLKQVNSDDALSGC